MPAGRTPMRVVRIAAEGRIDPQERSWPPRVTPPPTGRVRCSKGDHALRIGELGVANRRAETRLHGIEPRTTPIARHIRSRVDEALTDTPVVVLQGARQVGKSTLAASFVAQGSGRLVTLDDAPVREAALSDPTGFLESIDGLLVIDEVQRALNLADVAADAGFPARTLPPVSRPARDALPDLAGAAVVDESVESDRVAPEGSDARLWSGRALDQRVTGEPASNERTEASGRIAGSIRARRAPTAGRMERGTSSHFPLSGSGWRRDRHRARACRRSSGGGGGQGVDEHRGRRIQMACPTSRPGW